MLSEAKNPRISLLHLFVILQGNLLLHLSSCSVIPKGNLLL